MISVPRNPWCAFFALVGLGVSVVACSQEDRIGKTAQAFRDHEQTVRAIASSSRKTMSADDMASLWWECKQVRDLAGARLLANSESLALQPYWKGCFAILAGDPVNRCQVLSHIKAEDIESNDARAVAKVLFCMEDLKAVANPAAQQVQVEVEGAVKRANELGGNIQAYDGALSAQGCQGELYFYLMKRQAADWKLWIREALALAAFASCHYDVAMEQYNLVREEVRNLPKEYRNVTGCGMDVFYLAYYAQRPIGPLGQDGWLEADGIEIQVDPAESVLRKLDVVRATEVVQKQGGSHTASGDR